MYFNVKCTFFCYVFVWKYSICQVRLIYMQDPEIAGSATNCRGVRQAVWDQVRSNLAEKESDANAWQLIEEPPRCSELGKTRKCKCSCGCRQNPSKTNVRKCTECGRHYGLSCCGPSERTCHMCARRHPEPEPEPQQERSNTLPRSKTLFQVAVAIACVHWMDESAVLKVFPQSLDTVLSFVVHAKEREPLGRPVSDSLRIDSRTMEMAWPAPDVRALTSASAKYAEALWDLRDSLAQRVPEMARISTFASRQRLSKPSMLYFGPEKGPGILQRAMDSTPGRSRINVAMETYKGDTDDDIVGRHGEHCTLFLAAASKKRIQFNQIKCNWAQAPNPLLEYVELKSRLNDQSIEDDTKRGEQLLVGNGLRRPDTTRDIWMELVEWIRYQKSAKAEHVFAVRRRCLTEKKLSCDLPHTMVGWNLKSFSALPRA